MQNVTVEMIMQCEANADGWRVLPDGSYVKIGSYVEIGSDVEIGSGVKIGSSVKIGSGVKIEKTPIYIQGRRYWIGYCGEKGMIRSGCINNPIKWWLENVEQCAEENGYSEIEQTEYRLHVEHVAAWMRLYGVAEN